MGVKTKKELVKLDIIKKHGCTGVCSRCAKINSMIDLMEESNIPIEYWFLGMKNFIGNDNLKSITENYIKDLNKNYLSGKSICFSGNQGIGKTLSAICILKSAIKNNLSTYYITASDVLNLMTNPEYSSKMREIFKEVDYLVIDELDSRFFPSDSVKELFSGIYENIFRFRSHNGLPTIICTNETGGILKVFYGQATQSIQSLNNQYLTIYPVVGVDFRKQVN